MDTNWKMFSQKNIFHAMHSCWGQHNVQTANEKSKMVVNCKKMWARLPENSVSSQSMAANSWSLGPPSAPGYLVCCFGYAWFRFWILFASSCNKLFYSISICFGNDRNTPIRTEVSPVVIDGLQELVKLIHSWIHYQFTATQWFSSVDFWYMTIGSQFAHARTTLCIELCRMMPSLWWGCAWLLWIPLVS